MQWLDLNKAGMTLSVQQAPTGKQRFYVQITNLDLANPHLDYLKKSGFVSESQKILSAPLTYKVRNSLMSIKDANLFPTAKTEQHENPYDGFRNLRTTGTETSTESPTSDVPGKKNNGEPGNVPPEHRPGNTRTDRDNVSPVTARQSVTQNSNISGKGPTNQLGDGHSNTSDSARNDIVTTGEMGTGAGGNESDRSAGNVGPGNGEPLIGGIEKPEINDWKQLKNHNPNHFFITDEITREGGFEARKRIAENKAAIVLLKELEKEDRPATQEEKSILARYNGWGGIELYRVKYGEGGLNELLTEEEMTSVESSVLNSHFTPPVVIKPLWQSIKDDLGFTGGKINEPSVGVGNFLGLAPEEIVHNSKFSATELETITGRIAQKIYPDAKINIKGFEDQRIGDNQLDLVISNIPFGKYKIHDKSYKKDHAIHNYFIIRSLDKLKPGGIGVFVTSSYSMDSLSRDARREMHNKGQLLAALRLPEDVMKAQANTTVTTDILIFQKRVNPRPLAEPDPAWLDVYESEVKYSEWGKPSKFRTNRHFIDNPEANLGFPAVAQRQYGRRVRTVVADPDRPLEQLLPKVLHDELTSDKVVRILEENQKALARKTSPENRKKLELVDLADTKKTIDSFIRKEGKIYQIVNNDGKGVEVKGSSAKLAKISAFIDIREAINRLYDVQRKTIGNDPEYLDEQERLNQEYDRFILKHGYLNASNNRKIFQTDPEAGKVLALENFDQKTQKATKADIFTKRVIGRPEIIESVDTAKDALILCLDRHNQIEIDVISSLCNKSIKDVLAELEEDIFHDPTTQRWEPAAIYLSGNVRKKLENALSAAEEEPRYKKNVEALKRVIPPTIPAEEIRTRLGAPWISVDLHKKFVVDLLGAQPDDVNLYKRSIDSKWSVDIDNKQISQTKMTIDYGTDRKNFTEILKSCLAQRIVQVNDIIEIDGKKKSVYNHEATVAAQYKQEEIQQQFRDFIWGKDPERAAELEKLYNERHNCYVPPTFDGSHLTFPGMSPFISPRKVQADAVYRGMHSNVLLNHEVGVGKTLEQICIAMEWRRLGIARKPMMVIPKHTLDQINKEALKIYPTAKILLASDADFEKKNRKKFIGKVANNEWDLVIVGHTMAERISVNPDFEKAYLQDIVNEYKAELRAVGGETENLTKTRQKKYGEKDIQTKIRNLNTKIQRLTDIPKDELLMLDQLGIDGLLIDEAHRYKNLMIISGSTEVAGQIKGSKRAWDLFMKTKWLKEERGDNKGLVFATGTPITNNPMEIYNMQRYLQMDTLEELGIENATEWYANHINPKISWEPSHAARGWNLRVRPALHNVPELISVFRDVMDVVTADQAGIKRPKVNYETIVTPMSPLQEEFMDELDAMVHDNDTHIFTIMHHGRTMALEPKLLLQHKNELPENYKDPIEVKAIFPFHSEDILDPPTSKLNSAANIIFNKWQESHDIKGTQLVFADLGVPHKDRIYNVYDDLKDKMVCRGIPAEQIAFIHDFPKDHQKATLFEKVRQGEVRVLMGSTQKMGEGLNVQDRIVASHNLDAPYTPALVEQRNGRSYRFGNMNDEVTILNYTTKDTFDLFIWNLLKIKNEQFKQILTGTSNLREFDFELDPTYAETAAMTSGNPLIKEKLETDEEIVKLEALESQFLNEKSRAKWMLSRRLDEIDQLASLKEQLENLPNIPENPAWKIKFSKYSLWDKDFETEDIKEFEKALEVLKKQTHLTMFKDDTLSFGDINISYWNEKNPYVKNESVKIYEGGGIRRSKPKDLADLFKRKEDVIDRLNQKIEKLEKESSSLKEKLDKVFEHQEKLVHLKIKINDIERRIEKEARKDQNEPENKKDKTSNNFEDRLLLLDSVKPSILSEQDKNGNNIAHYVVKIKNNPEILQKIHEKNSSILMLPNKNGDTPIDLIYKNKLKGYEKILDQIEYQDQGYQVAQMG